MVGADNILARYFRNELF